MPYPVALFVAIKTLRTAWKTSFALTWKGWIQFPGNSVGDGLSSVAKSFTSSYHAALAAGAEFPFTSWLIYLFVVAMYKIPLNFLYLYVCVFFLGSCGKRDQEHLLLIHSPASSDPHNFPLPKICSAPGLLCAYQGGLQHFLLLFCTLTLEYAYALVLPPEYLADENYSSVWKQKWGKACPLPAQVIQLQFPIFL